MVAASLVKTGWIRSRAPAPANESRPMWLTSKMPAPVRTAVCASVMVVYWMGMSHPPKSTIRAPCETCQSYRTVRIDHLAPGGKLGRVADSLGSRRNPYKVDRRGLEIWYEACRAEGRATI